MLVNTSTDLENLVAKLKQCTEIAFDFETTDLHHKRMSVLGISFYGDKLDDFYYVNFDNSSAIGKIYGFGAIKNIFSTDATFIAHNYVFDGKVLKYFYNTTPNKIFDTMVAAWYLDENRASFGLKQLAKELLGIDMVKYKDVDKEDIDKFSEYGAMDSYATYQLYKTFSKELEKQPKLYSLFTELEMPFLEVLISITLAGFRIDHQFLRNMSEGLRVRREILNKELTGILGGININSTQQLCEALYGIQVKRVAKETVVTKVKKGLVEPKLLTPKGAPSTSDSALDKLDHPIIEQLKEYRGIEKLLTTYVEGYQRFIIDGFIYPNFNPIGTVSGRLSSNTPNMQNLSRNPTDGWFIRDAFICPEGYNLIVADESQLELRLLAHFSKDPALVEAFLSEGDVHTRTASQILQKPPEEVTKVERQQFKTINFGIMYGMGPKKLADSLKISEGDAKYLLQRYFETYQGVREWFNSVERTTKKNGYIKTIIGRYRRLPDIWSKDNALYSRARRQAINSIIQGSAADILKVAMVKIYQAFKDAGLDAQILSQIHDELVVQCRERECEKAAEIMKDYMEHPFSKDLIVPLIVEPSIVKRWSDGK